MKDLINRGDALAVVMYGTDKVEGIKNLPAADAVVEVVRCKDCKHYQYGRFFTDIKFCFRLKNRKGEAVGYNWSDDDFCSYGEEK